MNEINFSKTVEQAAAFQKIWMESMSKTMQAAYTVNPAAPPSEMLLQFRGGIFKALAESWEEFMRSPQFLEGMQQWMEHTINFRKMSNDLLGKIRNEVQSPSRDDVDAIMVSVRHNEKRLLDRIDELSSQIKELASQLENHQHAQPASTPEPQPAAAKSKRAATITAKKGAKQ